MTLVLMVEFFKPSLSRKLENCDSLVSRKFLAKKNKQNIFSNSLMKEIKIISKEAFNFDLTSFIYEFTRFDHRKPGIENSSINSYVTIDTKCEEIVKTLYVKLSPFGWVV